MEPNQLWTQYFNNATVGLPESIKELESDECKWVTPQCLGESTRHKSIAPPTPSINWKGGVGACGVQGALAL